jgi:hypothetical protein
MVLVRSISLPQAGHKFFGSRLSPRMVVILTSQAEPAVMTVTIAGFLVGSHIGTHPTTSGDAGNQLKLVDRTIDGALSLDA